MSSQGQEFSGRSVEEAVEAGLQALNLSEDAVDIEVVSRGSRGILGFGSEPAVVRITQRGAATNAAPAAINENDADDADATSVAPAEDVTEAATEIIEETTVAEVLEDVVVIESDGDEAANDASNEDNLEELASDLLGELLELMGFNAEIVASWEAPLEEEEESYLNLDIRGDDLGVLIGRRGETLSNIQFILRLMINQRMRSWQNVVVDVEQYKQRRVDQLTQLAERMAEQVATSERPVSLEPMPANERRIIHIALRDHPAVYTESIGEGDRRKITILPRT